MAPAELQVNWRTWVGAGNLLALAPGANPTFSRLEEAPGWGRLGRLEGAGRQTPNCVWERLEGSSLCLP